MKFPSTSKPIQRRAFLGALGALVVQLSFLPVARAQVTSPLGGLALCKAYGRLPLYFEANQGQADPQVKFFCRGNDSMLFITPREAVLFFGQNHGTEALQMVLKGADPKALWQGMERAEGKANYLIGKDPSHWRTHVPLYTRVGAREVYPGIDMVYYGKQGHIEYDFVVKPGADPKDIVLRFKGGKVERVKQNGDLVVEAGKKKVIFKAPAIYQDQPVAGGYVLRNANEVGFQVAGYDPNRPLVIDPILDYSTYLGQSAQVFCKSLAVDGGGNAYLTGQVQTTGFPTTPGAPQTTFSAMTAFVAKLNPSGTGLVYATYLGGSGGDYGRGIAVDGSGNAYVTGYTTSTDFPTSAGAPQTVKPGGMSAFLSKLNSAGTALVYSTYLGGSVTDMGSAVALDKNNNVFVVGQTASTNLPTTAGAAQTAHGADSGEYDAFVAEFNSSGTSLVYSTYLGGNGYDVGLGIALDGNGNAYVIGETYSTNFPTTPGVFQTSFFSGDEAFVAKLNSTGGLVYSTYLGSGDQGNGIAVDGSGDAFLVLTSNDGFPTSTFAYKRSLGGTTYSNPLVVKLNPTATGLLYATYVGGSSVDQGWAIALDKGGNAYLTGITTSTDFPTTSGAVTAGVSNSAFLTELNSAGSSLIYSTCLAGSGGSQGTAVALDPSGNAYVAGYAGTNFPTTAGAAQTAFGGTTNGFVSKFDQSDFDTPTPTSTPTSSPTLTPTATPTFTPTPTATPTSPLPTATPTSTPTPPPAGGHPYVFPNPATGPMVQFVYTMGEAGRAEIKVYNSRGDLAASLEEPKNPGPQQSSLSIGSLASGHYFYQVTLEYDSGREDRFAPQVLAVNK